MPFSGNYIDLPAHQTPKEPEVAANSYAEKSLHRNYMTVTVWPHEGRRGVGYAGIWVRLFRTWTNK